MKTGPFVNTILKSILFTETPGSNPGRNLKLGFFVFECEIILTKE